MAKRYFMCPLCERRDAASIQPRKPAGEWGERWWVGCLRCEAEMEGPQYLKELAKAIGCKAIDLLQRADVLLADLLDQGQGLRRGTAPSLPDEDTLAKCAAALQSSNGPLKYLTDRGISREALAEHQVGLNIGRRLTFPMRDGAGQVVAIKYRRPTPHGQMRNISGSGRAWPLYPWPAKKDTRPLIICAGELDALCTISAGLDACSVTLGAGTWRHEWTAAVYLRRVVIVFDNGERVQARRLRDELLLAGVSVRIVSLRQLGLNAPKGDLSDYLLGGGDPTALVNVRG